MMTMRKFAAFLCLILLIPAARRGAGRKRRKTIRIPLELMRAALTKRKQNFTSTWKFHGVNP